MLIWRPRSRSTSHVVVIADAGFTAAREMLRLRGRQMSMTGLRPGHSSFLKTQKPRQLQLAGLLVGE